MMIAGIPFALFGIFLAMGVLSVGTLSFEPSNLTLFSMLLPAGIIWLLIPLLSIVLGSSILSWAYLNRVKAGYLASIFLFLFSASSFLSIGLTMSDHVRVALILVGGSLLPAMVLLFLTLRKFAGTGNFGMVGCLLVLLFGLISSAGLFCVSCYREALLSTTAIKINACLIGSGFTLGGIGLILFSLGLMRELGLPPQVRCRSCGAPLAPGARFCRRCGARA